MKRIPEATEIELTDAERRELETLSRSGKSEARMQLRSRIVLMAVGSGKESRSAVEFWLSQRGSCIVITPQPANSYMGASPTESVVSVDRYASGGPARGVRSRLLWEECDTRHLVRSFGIAVPR